MKIKVEYLYPGMELAEEVIDPKTNEIQFFKGVILNRDNIIKLSDSNIEEVLINEINSIDSLNGNFRKYIKESIQDLNFDKIKYLASLFDTIYDDNDTIIYDLTKYSYQKMDYLDHIINVLAYSTTVAKFYNLTVSSNNKINLSKLALSCMLLGIGKACKDVYDTDKLRVYANLFSTDKYPNYNPKYFDKYDENMLSFYSSLMARVYGFDDQIAETILLSGEFYTNKDGFLGYTLDKDTITVKMASLISVCEVYDMLLIEGGLKDKEEPFKEVVDRLNKYCSQGFISSFWAKYVLIDIPLFREGQKVILSDNTLAIVRNFNMLSPFKPEIEDLSGNKIDYTDDLKVIRVVNQSD